MLQNRIRFRSVVNEGVDTNSGGIELPVSNGTPIGAPAKTVANIEFFFVDPIGGAIDQGLRAVCCQRPDRASIDIFKVDIIGPHIRDAAPIG